VDNENTIARNFKYSGDSGGCPKDNCCKSAELVLLSTENRIKTMDGMFFCQSSGTVKQKESTNGYLGIQGHER